MNNNVLRKTMIQKRKTLTKKQRNLAAFKASLFLPKLLSLLPKNAKIALFLDGFGEIPTSLIIKFCQKHQFLIYLPITKKNKPLLFAPFLHPKTPLKKHRFGMYEPLTCPQISANKLDAIICPLVLVDKKGNRIGMGGGFYDRTFAKNPNVLKIGYAYDFQLVENLKTQVWDKKIDLLITDKNIYRF